MEIRADNLDSQILPVRKTVRVIGGQEPIWAPCVLEVLRITMSCFESSITDAVFGTRYNGGRMPLDMFETADMDMQIGFGR